MYVVIVGALLGLLPSLKDSVEEAEGVPQEKKS